MKWKINLEGYVIDEDGAIVCAIPRNADERYHSLIKYAPDMFDAIVEFLDGFETNKRTPKKYFDRFQRIRDNINDY